MNEAYWFGLPVLGSCHAGAALDLIPRTGIGEMLEPRDVEAFAATLARWCASMPERRPDVTRPAVAALSCESSAEAAVRMIRSLVHTRSTGDRSPGARHA
jgi:hypothetical protein